MKRTGSWLRPALAARVCNEGEGNAEEQEHEKEAEDEEDALQAGARLPVRRPLRWTDRRALRPDESDEILNKSRSDGGHVTRSSTARVSLFSPSHL